MFETVIILLVLAGLYHFIFTYPAQRNARSYMMGQKRSFGKLAPKNKRSFCVISLQGKKQKCTLEYTKEKKIILKVDSDHGLQLVMSYDKTADSVKIREFPPIGHLEEQQQIEYELPPEIKGTVTFTLHNTTLHGAEIMRFAIEAS